MADSGRPCSPVAAAASPPTDSFDLRRALNNINPSPSNDDSLLAGPIGLFAADYDANDGSVTTMVTSPTRQAKANCRTTTSKRNLSPVKPSSNMGSPLPKRIDQTRD